MSDSNQRTSAQASEMLRPDVWKFSTDVSDRLLTWNMLNIVTGMILGRSGGFLRGFASQNIGWGLINSAIAVFGNRLNRRRIASLDDPFDPSVQQVQSRNLRLILAFNGLLDILYIFAGRRVARGAKPLSVRRGAGWGIVVQGTLLFLFDWIMFRRSFWIRNS